MQGILRDRGLAVVLVVLGAVSLAGCSTGGEAESASRDRARSKTEWLLILDDGGEKRQMPLERMDIYLTEDDAYPEVFEMYGEGVVVSGTFPPDLRVGYGEEFEKLVGKTIPIAAHGGDPREPKTSAITFGAASDPVTGGSITVEKVSGKWSGSEGNKTLHGTIRVEIGGRTLEGRFAVHAVTWG